MPAAVARTLAASADWPDEHALFGSWFEQGDDIAALLSGKRRSGARKVAAILAGPIEQRRRRWAEMLLWTAYSANDATVGAAPWQEFTIVARELLSGRPLADIGLMRRIAEQTVEANDGRGRA